MVPGIKQPLGTLRRRQFIATRLLPILISLVSIAISLVGVRIASDGVRIASEALEINSRSNLSVELLRVRTAPTQNNTLLSVTLRLENKDPAATTVTAVWIDESPSNIASDDHPIWFESYRVGDQVVHVDRYYLPAPLRIDGRGAADLTITLAVDGAPGKRADVLAWLQRELSSVSLRVRDAQLKDHPITLWSCRGSPRGSEPCNGALAGRYLDWPDP